MRCMVTLVLLAASTVASPSAGQAPATRLTFDVASIRENTEIGQGGQMSWSSGRFVASNIPLPLLILSAYQIREHQLLDLPGWARTARFSITATYPLERPTESQVYAMIQSLLADRFGFMAHREIRDLPRYRLVLARADGKLGPNLVRAGDLDCDAYLTKGGKQIGAAGPSIAMPSGLRPQCLLAGNRGWLSGGTRTMRQIVNALQIEVERAVIDDTGLTGTYNIDLVWKPATGLPQPAAVDADDRVSIFTAVQEQLGLRLVAEEGPLDVLVIDAVSRPTPN